MKGTVTFAPTGKGKGKVARVIIPKAYIELMNLTDNDRTVDITYKNDSVIITKSEKTEV